jgi:hypothetical protein
MTTCPVEGGATSKGLRRVGVHLLYGDDVWPLHEPRSAPGRELPWAAMLCAIETAVPAER